MSKKCKEEKAAKRKAIKKETLQKMRENREKIHEYNKNGDSKKANEYAALNKKLWELIK